MARKKFSMFFAVCFPVVGCLVLLYSGCADVTTKNITMKGSDTMVNLASCWAEAYMKKNPGVTIAVTGGGSGVGITALINGATDICLSSRKMSEKEIASLQEQRKENAREIVVAGDAVAVFVHPDCPLQELTLEQLRDIYRGKITNWKELGWEDREIIPYGRENTSGTYVYFKEKVLKKEDFRPDVLALSGTSGVVHAVANDRWGIGYGGIGYVHGVRSVGIKETETSPAVLPSAQTFEDGSYPLARPLFFYVLESRLPEVQHLIDWILSEEGQNICLEQGYFPIRRRGQEGF